MLTIHASRDSAYPLVNTNVVQAFVDHQQSRVSIDLSLSFTMQFDTMDNAQQAMIAHDLTRDFRGLASRLHADRVVPYTSVYESIAQKDSRISRLQAQIKARDHTINGLQARLRDLLAEEDDEILFEQADYGSTASGAGNKRVRFAMN